MQIIDKILEKGEYVEEKTPKNTIYLHHTAGSHRADWTIDTWNTDRNKTTSARIRVATAFVIGGVDKATGLDKDNMDGKIYRAYNEDFWASHLGLKAGNNTLLNKQSIGIEICNYGPLTKSTAGTYFNYVNSIVHPSQVCDLGYMFRGFRFHQKYSDKQIASLKELLLFLANKYSIDLKKGLVQVIDKPNGAGYEISTEALAGKPGMWSHSNVRKDKSDIHPQAELTAMLKNL